MSTDFADAYRNAEMRQEYFQASSHTFRLCALVPNDYDFATQASLSLPTDRYFYRINRQFCVSNVGTGRR